ncbi:hypothetical protein BRADI_3g05945v3 [Brachypodium distachyon]|uniref:Neprosin domain-containing protein n=1 Tax=Brachypodium distachyon TaxID=15368 RepID=A0A2K2CVH3_BRADI|nr:hypothetical protein BRADI_3g05945v3 [Brachypodium distachyon]PNT66025.1 hypothetical protein BRADI_3g05945v3 [Brachypodium distachyon]
MKFAQSDFLKRGEVRSQSRYSRVNMMDTGGYTSPMLVKSLLRWDIGLRVMSDHANHLSWGVFTGSRAGEPSPPMGNGHRLGPDSAASEDVQYVNNVGQGYPGGVYAK